MCSGWYDCLQSKTFYLLAKNTKVTGYMKNRTNNGKSKSKSKPEINVGSAQNLTTRNGSQAYFQCSPRQVSFITPGILSRLMLLEIVPVLSNHPAQACQLGTQSQTPAGWCRSPHCIPLRHHVPVCETFNSLLSFNHWSDTGLDNTMNFMTLTVTMLPSFEEVFTVKLILTSSQLIFGCLGTWALCNHMFSKTARVTT